jgi:hypothetical protein
MRKGANMIHDFRHPDFTLPDENEQKTINDQQRADSQAEAARLTLTSTSQTGETDADVLKAMSEDPEYAEIMRPDGPYWNKRDVRHANYLKRAEALFERYSQAKIHYEPDTRPDAEMVAAVNSYLPELMPLLQEAGVNPKTWEPFLAKIARDEALSPTKDKAQELVDFIETNKVLKEKRFSSKVTDAKISRALSAITYLLREHLDK